MICPLRHSSQMKPFSRHRLQLKTWALANLITLDRKGASFPSITCKEEGHRWLMGLHVSASEPAAVGFLFTNPAPLLTPVLSSILPDEWNPRHMLLPNSVPNLLRCPLWRRFLSLLVRFFSTVTHTLSAWTSHWSLQSWQILNKHLKCIQINLTRFNLLHSSAAISRWTFTYFVLNLRESSKLPFRKPFK